MKNNKLAVLAMSVISILWAPTFQVTKILLEKLGPLSLICFRFGLSAVLLFIIRKSSRSKEKIKPKDFMLFFIVTLCCALHYICSNVASLNIDATESIVFSSFQCLLTMICTSLLLGTLITPRMSLCVAISAIGAILTMNIKPLQSNTLPGYYFMFFATGAWVIYCVLMPKLLSRYKITTIIYYQSLLTSAILIPSLFFENNQWQQMQISDSLPLIYLGVLCVGVCLMLNGYGLKVIGPIPVSVFMNVGPIIVLILNVSSKQSNLSILKLIGILMIVLGIILTGHYIIKGHSDVLNQ